MSVSPIVATTGVPRVAGAEADEPGAPREILLVEDNATDAELALRAFTVAAFVNPVTVVSNAERGLDYLLGAGTFATRGPTRPHLILLDLNLPKMSGIEFLQRVRSDPRTRAIPVVVLSLSERDRDVTACIQLGAEAYLVKPINFANFTRITAALKLRLTLIERPRDGRSSGWVLSGACVRPGERPPGTGAAPEPGADSAAIRDRPGQPL